MNNEILKNKKEIFDLVSKYYEKFHNIKKTFENGDRISYAGRTYDDNELINLVDTALDFWLTAGDYCNKFEKEFAQYLNIKYCALVNSGASANLLAFMALTSPLLGDRKINRGDEVITVACGFPTTITPIINYGAFPVFVDITIPSYNIDVSKLGEALSNKTKAVMIAHTLGNPFDLKSVKDFCDNNNLWLIEDNCDALGSTYTLDGKEYMTGTLGDIGTSSFYPPHHMTMGEGGAVYTNSSILNKIIISMRDWGRDCVCNSGQDNLCGHRFDRKYGELPLGYDHKYVYSHFGYNLKATEMQAAIGVAQLGKLDEFNRLRRANYRFLYDALYQYGDRLILPVATSNSDPSWFGFPITVKDGIERNKLVQFLEDNGVQTRMLFSSNMILHPCFDQMRNEEQGYRIVSELVNTNNVLENTFWIGVAPTMTMDKLEFIVELFNDFFTSK